MSKKNRFRIFTAAICVCSLLCGSLVVGAVGTSNQYISNSDVMPRYVSDEYVDLEVSDEEGTLLTPAWLKTAIIAQVRLEKISSDGTLEGALSILDHYNEMGVNCLWLNPIGESGTAVGYTNYGPQSISPALTGTTDYDEGWERFAWFVRQAHKRNIRIMVDFTIWGCHPQSPLIAEHPELFTYDEDGNIIMNSWGGPSYDYEGEALQKWYRETMLNILEVTNIDGMRLDLEPGVTGYEFWGSVRTEAYKRGRKIVLMTEKANERNGVFDFEQGSVIDLSGNWSFEQQLLYENRQYYLDYLNVVDSVKTGNGIGSSLAQNYGESGTFRFYSYGISYHDDEKYCVGGNLLRIGYQAIFTPFIPIWYAGEELGDQRVGQLYSIGSLDYSLLENESNRDFYETLKKYIRIRRTYADIFEYFPINHRESNICKVEVAGLERLQAYARFGDGKAILIVPNDNLINTEGNMAVTIPFEGMGAEKCTSVRVTDLMTDTIVATGSAEKCGMFHAKVPSGKIGVYLVETQGVKKATYITKEVGDGSHDTLTETTIENPITQKKKVTETVKVVEADWLSSGFWIALSACAAVVAGSGVLLTIYLVKQKKRRKE